MRRRASAGAQKTFRLRQPFPSLPRCGFLLFVKRRKGQRQLAVKNRTQKRCRRRDFHFAFFFFGKAKKKMGAESFALRTSMRERDKRAGLSSSGAPCANPPHKPCILVLCQQDDVCKIQPVFNAARPDSPESADLAPEFAAIAHMSPWGFPQKCGKPCGECE